MLPVLPMRKRNKVTFFDMLLNEAGVFFQGIRDKLCKTLGHSWASDKETVFLWRIRCKRCAIEWNGTFEQYKLLKSTLKKESGKK